MSTPKHVLMFDVDDTVCESTKPLSDNMAAVLQSLLDKNFLLVFTSGSTLNQIYNQLYPKLTGQYWLMGTSGSACEFVRNGQRQPLFNTEIPAEDRQEILNILNETVEKFGIQTMTTKEDQIQDRISQVTLSCIGRGAPSELKAKFDPDKSKRKIWVEYIKSKLTKPYTIKMGGTTSIDITISGMDKAVGAKRWLTLTRFPEKSVLFFGDQLSDGGNDFVMKTIVDCIPVQSPDDTLEKLKFIDTFFYKW